MSERPDKQVQIMGWADFDPSPGRVLCRLYRPQETTSGLHLPENASTGYAPFIEVLKVGAPYQNASVAGDVITTPFAPGEFVAAFAKSYQDIYMQHETLMVCRFEELIGWVKLTPFQQRYRDKYLADLADKSKLAERADVIAEQTEAMVH